MFKHLVIVESPAKAKTISRFLGKNYRVLASMGHVRDLPKSEMGIDVAKDFAPSYIISPDKKKVITQLKSELSKAKELWIATDEDREGEAIGWHLLSALSVNEKKMPVHRIVFHEITKPAIEASLLYPRKIDKKLVDAQQARRILDRLVGYELSPLLWKKVKTGLSAGRVQSVAVRLVVEREREIDAFKPVEYWRAIGDFEAKKGGFQAELKYFKGKKLTIGNEKDARHIEKILKTSEYLVASIEEKEVRRNPAPPFITSTLQQEASRKLGFSVKKTMMVAQQLYEGVDIGEGESGLITYMRTDSVNLSEVALKAAQELIKKEYGPQFALDTPRRYRSKKGAQEAHEAIRPVEPRLTPDAVQSRLSRDQHRLYELIWKRMIASQMKQAVLNRVAVDIDAVSDDGTMKKTGYTFRANGQTIVFPGFMEVYLEGRDEEVLEGEGEGEMLLPVMTIGEKVDLRALDVTQHFTKPPARYTEASLVKKLEEEGIGRPSTYAPVIHTIQQRGYVRKEGRQLAPEDVAYIVIDLLIAHFSDIVDVHFTAEMEQALDHIAEGKEERGKFLEKFYRPFHSLVEKKSKEIKREDVLKEHELGTYEGLPVIARFGRFGAYVQLGRIEDMPGETDKEKKGNLVTASLPRDLSLDDVTLEQALFLLSMPRKLGTVKGEEVMLLQGPYGPYLKWGGKNISLPRDIDIFTVDLEVAQKVVSEVPAVSAEPLKVLGKDPVSQGEIQVKEGRFGPYVTDGKTNVSVPKKISPKDVDFATATALLAKKREGGGGRRRFVRRK